MKVQGREEKVRLREIDAPEISTRRRQGQEPWGGNAKRVLLSTISKKSVRLEVEEGEERDEYHRLLAYVFVGELFVNREMIRSGNAFFYGGPFVGRHYKELKRAEKEARERGYGVWDRKNGLREKPWDFRRRRR